MLIQFKNGQALKNISLVSVKYGAILGISYLLLSLLNLLILVTPNYSDSILSLLIVSCLAIGYFYATKKNNPNSDPKMEDQLNPKHLTAAIESVQFSPKVNLYPNPISNKLNIDIGLNNSILDIRIFDTNEK